MYLRNMLYGYPPSILYSYLTQPIKVRINPILTTNPEPIPTPSETTTTPSEITTSPSETTNPPVMYRSFYSDTLLPPKSHTDRAIVHTSKLQTLKEREYYKAKGLQWLRRYDTKSYPAILRNPTMGCNVELLSKPNLYTVHIDSPQAKKIICRVCYF